MPTFSYKDQEQLLNTATEILNYFNIDKWSFGGGTALAAKYFEHRMSFDIDIFMDDLSMLQKLLDSKEFIAEQLQICPKEDVETSAHNISFILSDEGAGLKIDFLCNEYITKIPYKQESVLGKDNINVQTPDEIIAKKMKYREIVTERDYVDFAYVQTTHNTIMDLKKQRIVSLERFIDIWEQFLEIEDSVFEKELAHLGAKDMETKECIKKQLKKVFNPSADVSIAYNESQGVISMDDWIEDDRELWETIEDYHTVNDIPIELFAEQLNKNKEDVTYRDIEELDNLSIKKILDAFQ